MKYTPSLFGILLLVLIILLLHFLYIPCSSSSRSLCLRTPRFSFAISFILRYSFHHTRSHFSPHPFASGDSAGNESTRHRYLVFYFWYSLFYYFTFYIPVYHFIYPSLLVSPYAESLLSSSLRFRRLRWE